MCNGARNMKMATWDSLESRWVIKQCSVSNICSVKIDKARGELELVSQTWVKPNLRLKTFSKWRVCISRLNRYLWNWLFKSGGKARRLKGTVCATVLEQSCCYWCSEAAQGGTLQYSLLQTLSWLSFESSQRFPRDKFRKMLQVWQI